MRSILVVTDLSSSEMDTAVERAAQLACAHDTTLKLVYLPKRQASPVPDAARLLTRLARQLEQSQMLRTICVTRTTGCLRDVAREALNCDLIVFPDRRDRSLPGFFLGQPVLRLLKICERPILLARTTASALYARVLVGVDFRDGCRAMTDFAAALAPQARLELFHAIDTRGEAYLTDADVSEQAIRAYRASRLLGTQDKLLRLSDSFGSRRNRVMTALGRGDAGRQIVVQQEHTRADLVVVGADRTSALIPLYSGSVARRVLAWGSSDVLVIPHGYAPFTRSAAARRLSSDHPPGRLVHPTGAELRHSAPGTTSLRPDDDRARGSLK